MPKNPFEQVLKTIRNYDMLNPDDNVVVAVSGGPDSVFLLHALNCLKSKLKLRRLCVANMDHGLRGDESKADSLFVKGVSRKLGLNFIHKRVDLKKGWVKKLSTEEAARGVRYAFLADAAKKSGANVIATGHTIDDQAETILMRIIKGCSLKGAVGILPCREGWGGLRIIRPLIEIEKKEIENRLREEGIPYRTDRTNTEPVYFRNIVRRDVIPFLERYNPRLKRALFNMAAHLREDFEFIDEERRKRRGFLKDRGGNALEIRLGDIIVQPRALQKEILRDALDAIGGCVKKLSYKHWKELEGFIRHKRKGDSLDLPGGIRITKTADRLRLYKL